MDLNAVAADEVWVKCHQGPLESDFVALRHHSTWKLGKYRPGHSELAEWRMQQRPSQALERTATRCVFTFQMIKTVLVEASLALGGGRSAPSR